MIEITDFAVKRIQVLVQQQKDDHQKKIAGLRLTMKGAVPNVEYALAFVEEGKEELGDISVDACGIKVFMESKNGKFLEDVKIDFIQSLQQNGFKVENPKVDAVPASAPATPANLDSPEAIAVQKVLDVEINPGVAAHGGHITLVDVKDQVAYLRLGGGCQGCASASETLQQGVITAIKKAVPEIENVMDVTDHAGGNNPYYAGA